jgi:aryl-alcohol dehydrogenase-like predicted oxidoreductase
MSDPERIPFGGSELAITRVGIGAWAIGGLGARFTWGEQDDDVSAAAIRRAVDGGVNWVDTAPIYGVGHSEEVVGRAVRAIPEADRPYLFSKGGLRWDETALSSKVGARDSLRWEIEQSLRRLGVETIDLYQMHWPAEDGTPVEEYWATLNEFVAEGKARAVGLSNHGVDQLRAAEGVAHVTSLQPPFSAIKRDVAGDILPWCEQNGTGVIAYAPMQNGLLSGGFTRERAEALGNTDDWRGRDPQFSGDALRRNLQLVDALRPIAAGKGTSVSTIAIAWTLAFPGVTGAIVGGRSPEQVDGWIDALSVRLEADELETIAAAIERTGAGSGPSSPQESWSSEEPVTA